MKYIFEEFTIERLVDLINNNLIDLNPYYQRNFIWSPNPNDQSLLIDTILLENPLPNFFLYDKSDGTYQMVDGNKDLKQYLDLLMEILNLQKKQVIKTLTTAIYLKY